MCDQCGAVDPLMTLQLKGRGNDDPLECRQRVLPPFLFSASYEKSSSRIEAAISEVITLACFFAAHSCEFSTCYGERNTIIVSLGCARFLRKDSATMLHGDDGIFIAFSISMTFILTKMERRRSAQQTRAQVIDSSTLSRCAQSLLVARVFTSSLTMLQHFAHVPMEMELHQPSIKLMF